MTPDKNSYLMAVTADEYELPLYICKAASEMAEWLGIPTAMVRTRLHYDTHRRHRGTPHSRTQDGIWIVRVIMTEEL